MDNILFPYNKIRPSQDKLIEEVVSTINKKKNLVVHAPTGLGKTVSTLGPALKYAVDKDMTVLFLTSRHTQHLIVLETIKLIKEKFDLKFHVGDIIGKRWMCIQPGAQLLYPNEFFEFCKHMRETKKCEFYVNTRKNAKLQPKAERLVADIEIMSDHDSEKIKNLSEEEKLCPYEIAIDLAKKARVIICDYNYVFDPGIRESFFKKIDKELEKCILIVDEGHNLPERMRNIQTFKLSNFILKRAIKEAKKYGFNEIAGNLNAIQEVLLTLSDNLKDYDEEMVTREDFFNRVNEIKDFEELADDFEDAADDIREKQRQSYLGSIAFFMNHWNGDEEGRVRFISKAPAKRDLMITLFYRGLDPSFLTTEVFDRVHSAILMSGTLTPTGMYKEILGFSSRTEELSLPSPFPEDNKLSLIIPKTTTQYKKRSDEQYKNIAVIAANVVNSIPGNSAIFFPSYDIMRSVNKHFHDLCEKTTFKESSELTKEERKELLEKFKGYKNRGAVLLGVSSGSFGEGIDLPGDLLKGVIVVGLPLRKPNLETKELINYYDKLFGKGWDYGYIFPAFSKTLQSAGRCIRSETDRGIIVFLDERYTWPNYFKNFPPDMKLSISLDYIKKIEEFFTTSQ